MMKYCKCVNYVIASLCHYVIVCVIGSLLMDLPEQGWCSSPELRDPLGDRCKPGSAWPDPVPTRHWGRRHPARSHQIRSWSGWWRRSRRLRESSNSPRQKRWLLRAWCNRTRRPGPAEPGPVLEGSGFLWPRVETPSGLSRSSRLTRVPPPIRISGLGVHCRLEKIKILKVKTIE